ncbi:MAG TPA: ABC transporter ATP-binding protein [Acidobacteriota bacterium]|nr:ABC transporter ATP-binding protein [Acidobacteriota bacterium]
MSRRSSDYILDVQNLQKEYTTEHGPLRVLSNVTFSVPTGSSCAIVGPSGSGKTTLLGLCAGLDRPSLGQVLLDGVDLTTLTEEELARLRNHRVGFVFQTFQLIPTLTALENVQVPLELLGRRGSAKEAAKLLERVGLNDRLDHYPAQLSGGEQQRVALARAFIHRPRILFADEPTGNLDFETGKKIEDLIFELNQDLGTTLVLVTHNFELASRTDQIIRLREGYLEEDLAVFQKGSQR